MHIILLPKSCNASGAIHLCQTKTLLATILGGLVVISSLLYVGYWFGVRHGPIVLDGATLSEVQKEFTRQRAMIARTRGEAEAQMDALAVRLGQMQSHVSRLNALGQRLTVMSGLDRGEFDFTQVPAQGGPEEGSEDGQESTLAVGDFLSVLDGLAREIDDREQQLTVLEHLLLTHDRIKRSRPTGRPVETGWISSKYGRRIHPISGKKHFHHGIDLAGKEGSNVVAVADGIVTWSGWRPGYGNLVEITHGTGYVTRYAHNKQNLVEVGERVEQGQVIALLGSTGSSTGPHVHFEVVREGRSINPAQFMGVSG